MAVNTYDAALVKSALSEGKRLSGRNLYDIRPVSIETNLIEAAEGSAIVTLGNTKVIAGVKAEIGSPYSDSPDEGSITIDVELSPMADPNFESGPPTDTSIELSRVVDRGIRESKAIDFKSLCIVPGEKVWVLYCDIYIINNDGNLFDACSLAALAAFKTSHLPKLDDESNIVKDEKGPDLKLTNIPVLFTFAK
jgi:exosome complex component RRP42